MCSHCGYDYDPGDYERDRDAMDEDIDIVNELVYRSYAAQRIAAPTIAPHKWEPLFPGWQSLEHRYQAERGEAA